jgi:hypothetical protein
VAAALDQIQDQMPREKGLTELQILAVEVEGRTQMVIPQLAQAVVQAL